MTRNGDWDVGPAPKRRPWWQLWKRRWSKWYRLQTPEEARNDPSARELARRLGLKMDSPSNREQK